VPVQQDTFDVICPKAIWRPQSNPAIKVDTVAQELDIRHPLRNQTSPAGYQQTTRQIDT